MFKNNNEKKKDVATFLRQSCNSFPKFLSRYTDKKEKNVLIYKEIQKGAVANSYMPNGLLIYDKIFAKFPHILGRISSYIRTLFLIYDFATAPL
jgi:hypothetical protein